MYRVEPEITKEFILKYLDQANIFSYYFNHAVDLKDKYLNPLRNDKTPSCTYNWHNGILWFRDWPQQKSYSCFDIVQQMFNMTFSESIRKIAEDFDLVEGFSSIERYVQIVNPVHKETKIQVKRCSFTELGLKYWADYEIDISTLNYFEVSQISHLWINDNRVPIDELAFCYYFGNGKYKILQPYSDYKWISNTNKSIVQGYKQLPKQGELLIITKALKDVMCLFEIGINSIAFQNEAMLPDEKIIKELKSRFNTIISIYDYDYTGIVTMNAMKRLYNIKPMPINSLGVKDISDFVKFYSKQKLKQIYEQQRSNCVQYTNKRPNKFNNISPNMGRA